MIRTLITAVLLTASANIVSADEFRVQISDPAILAQMWPPEIICPGCPDPLVQRVVQTEDGNFFLSIDVGAGQIEDVFFTPRDGSAFLVNGQKSTQLYAGQADLHSRQGIILFPGLIEMVAR